MRSRSSLATCFELLRHCVEGKRPEDHVFTRGDKPSSRLPQELGEPVH